MKRTSYKRGWPGKVAVVAVALGAAGSQAAVATSPEPLTPDAVAATADAQIAAAQRVKETLSPAERKMSSRLVLALRRGSDTTLARSLPKLTDDLTRTRKGLVLDLQAQVSDDLLRRLRSVRATIIHASAAAGLVRVAVPDSAVLPIASWPDVRKVDPADVPITGSSSTSASLTPLTTVPSMPGSAARPFAAANPAVPTQGSVVSEGDVAHGADKARARHHVSGIGVKVCAISDGVTSLARSQSSGDLPEVDVLPGQAGDGDEGTAMLEIIHDLAPGARLGFATAMNGAGSFADNIRGLAAAGCDIIVDDVLYPRESPFQDGPIAQAVIDVTRHGVLYFSAAGNAGNVLSKTSGNYEGMFTDSKRSVGKMKGTAHDFDPSATRVQIFEPVTNGGDYPGTPTILQWVNPLGAAKDDYDLYLLDAAGNIVGMSQDVQNGTQDPIEGLMVPSPDLRLAVVKYSGRGVYLQLSSLRARYRDQPGLRAFSSRGMLRGHTAVPAAFSIAAAPAWYGMDSMLPGDPEGPTGPYPGVFTRRQVPETFTSDGPRRVFFRPDGSRAPAVRNKPDFPAADGGSTSLSAYSPFYGTSAAAPHAAAIAALVLSGNPGKGATFVRNAFAATALDLAPAGWDTRSGRGILRADLILDSTGATPQPYVTTGGATVTATSDGDAFLEPGESGTVAVTVTNAGDGAVTSATLALRSTSPGAVVTPSTSSVGALAAGQSATVPVTVTLPSDWDNGTPVDLAADLTFDGRLSPVTATLTLPTGKPGPVRTFAYDGPAVPIPDGDPTGVDIPITVTGMGSVDSLTLSIDGTACSTDPSSTSVGIAHSWVNDLSATLTSPSGHTATVWSRSGSSGANMCQVVFDDTAARAFSSAGYRDAPYTGSWKPIDALSGFRSSASANGTWILRVIDNSFGDSGVVHAASVHIQSLDAP